MTEASSAGLSTVSATLGRFGPPPGLVGRVGAFLAIVVEAFAEAHAMRVRARREFPYLSDDA